jgi:hypothetical protein
MDAEDAASELPTLRFLLVGEAATRKRPLLQSARWWIGAGSVDHRAGVPRGVIERKGATPGFRSGAWMDGAHNGRGNGAAEDFHRMRHAALPTPV